MHTLGVFNKDDLQRGDTAGRVARVQLQAYINIGALDGRA